MMSKRFARPFLVASLFLLTSVASAEELKVGQKAPDFTLPGTDGKIYKLADFVGKQGFVIAWYPKAFTSGCTAELESMRDNADLIATYDASVFLASVDSLEANADFAKATQAKHVLLSDPTRVAAKAFGVYGLMGMYAKRSTFYVDKDGIIREIDLGIETGTAGADIAHKLEALGFPKKAH